MVVMQTRQWFGCLLVYVSGRSGDEGSVIMQHKRSRGQWD